MRNPYRAYLHFIKKPFVFIDSHFNFGTNVFDREWDVLIILDACRYDLFDEFAAQHPIYQSFDSVGSMYSIASKSDDWLERTFKQADVSELARTSYITDTSHAGMVTSNDLYEIHTVEENAHNKRGGVLVPEAFTHDAITCYENSDADKFMIHYFQPHAPFLHCVGKYDSTATGGGQTQNVWQGLRDNVFDRRDVWADYGQNLLTVLDQVETVVDRVEGNIAVTSDHGNAMGEFGLYGHPFSGAVPSIRRVPWAIVVE